MFECKKVKEDIKKVEDYSILTRIALEGYINKLNTLEERVSALEAKKSVKKKRRYKKRIKKEQKESLDKVFGFEAPKKEVKYVRKNKKTRTTSK